MKCLDCGHNISLDEIDQHEGHEVIEGFFEENKTIKTAKDSYKLASKMWAEKMPKEDLFDFVRRLLNDLYKLSEEGNSQH